MTPAPAFGNRGERAAVDPPTPAVAAANRTDRGRWKPVECYECVVGIRGGFNQKPFAAKCIDVQVGGSKHRFVEVVKHAEWFVKGVGGNKAQTGDLKNVTVLNDIRGKLFNISPDGSSEVEAASGVELTEAEPTTEKEEEDEDVYPMDALNDLVETPTKRKPAPNNAGNDSECETPSPVSGGSGADANEAFVCWIRSRGHDNNFCVHEGTAAGRKPRATQYLSAHG